MKFSMLTFFLFLGQFCFSQDIFKNLDLNAEVNGILVYDYDNHLQVLDSSNGKVLRITSSAKSKITATKTCYLIHPVIQSGNDTITLYFKSGKINKQVFSLESDGDPIAQLAFTFDTIISKNRILANPILRAKSLRGILRNNFETLSFDCNIQSSNGKSYNISQNGENLGDPLVSRIEKLNKGDKLFFENIRIRTKDSPHPKAIPNLTITIN